MVALVGILKSSPPGMMDAHRIIGRDGTIEERPLGLALVAAASSSKASMFCQYARMARSCAGKSTSVPTLSNGITRPRGTLQNPWSQVSDSPLFYEQEQDFLSGSTGNGGMTQSIRLAVLLSGSGTTLQNLLDQIRNGHLTAQVVLVISNRPEAFGIIRAAQAGIETYVISRKEQPTAAAFGQAIFERCRRARVDLVCLAGFMQFLPIPSEFEGRIMNIHPSLIPAFCGKGFYGHHVHQAVLDYGAKVSGCTVHFVDNEYDHGPIILQKCVPVLPDDSPDTLAARVFEQECVAYPEAINLFAAGKLRIWGRKVVLFSDHALDAVVSPDLPRARTGPGRVHGSNQSSISRPGMLRKSFML